MRKKIVMLLFAMLFVVSCGTGAPTASPRPTERPVIVENTPIPVRPTLSPEFLEEILDEMSRANDADPATANPLAGAPAVTETDKFLNFVSNDVVVFWEGIYTTRYDAAKFVVWNSTEKIVTGEGQTWDPERGPVYINTIDTVYIPLNAFSDMVNTVGDFAMAAVIAHEHGHSVQDQFGIIDQLNAVFKKYGKDDPRFNNFSVRVELQADCLAGVWAYSTWQRQMLEAGDIDEALKLMATLGEDGTPEEMRTHGTAEARKAWFMSGYNTGSVASCDSMSTYDENNLFMPMPNVVSAPEPSPAPGGERDLSTLTGFFEYASGENCSAVDDGVSATVETIECTYGNVTVDYDRWETEASWNTYMDQLPGEFLILSGDTWSAEASGQSGPYVVFKNGDNFTVFWGVWGKPFTGYATCSVDCDEVGLVEWVLKYGMSHYYN